jgi:hypothetical protein
VGWSGPFVLGFERGRLGHEKKGGKGQPSGPHFRDEVEFWPMAILELENLLNFQISFLFTLKMHLNSKQILILINSNRK